MVPILVVSDTRLDPLLLLLGALCMGFIRVLAFRGFLGLQSSLWGLILKHRIQSVGMSGGLSFAIRPAGIMGIIFPQRSFIQLSVLQGLARFWAFRV